MAKMTIEDWKGLEEAMGVNETPSRIGSMLYKMLNDSGYNATETRIVALTLSSYIEP